QPDRPGRAPECGGLPHRDAPAAVLPQGQMDHPPDGGVHPSGPVLTGPPAKMKPTQHRKPPACTRQRLSALGEAYVSMMRGSMTEEGWPGGARPESGRLVEDGQLGVDVE